MCYLAQTHPDKPFTISAMAILNHTQLRTSDRQFGGSGNAGPTLVCPECGSSVYRVRRNTLDRLLSWIAPAQRFRCRSDKASFLCKWEGIIALKDIPARTIASYAPDDNLSTGIQPHRQIQNVPGLSKSARALGDLSFESMAQITLDAIGDAVLVVNPQGRVIYLNRIAETMTGWSEKLAVGRLVEEVFPIIDGASRQRMEPPSQRAINEDRIVALALGSILIRQDGSEIPIEDSAAPIRNHLGKIAGAVIVFHGADQSRVQIQKMSHLAQHDALTGLPNRTLLTERLNQAIGMAKRHNKRLALLFVDVDRFKLVNDTFGHTTGDHLLQDIAKTMLACIRTTDTVTRMGGDEFVILLPEIEDIQDPTRVAEKLLDAFTAPLTIDGHSLDVSLSIGISIYPDDGAEACILMQKADAAMYANKKNNPSNTA
jgi:diguanylate cyclase (GGDEF)-like protein/PAS domain S-box-containing protein